MATARAEQADRGDKHRLTSHPALLVQIPPWKFDGFPNLPTEIQLKVWEMALEDVNQPRIIAAHTMVPPASETHAMVRILARTCVVSRGVALKFMKTCREHEDRHYLAVPRSPFPGSTANLATLPAGPAGLAANLAALPGAPLWAAGNLASAVGNGGIIFGPTLFPNGNNVGGDAGHHQAPQNGTRVGDTQAPLRQLTARQRRTYKFDQAGEDLMESHFLLNSLHNHIHADNDYFLFVDETIRNLRYSPSDFASIIHKAEKIIVPASTMATQLFWHQLPSNHGMPYPEPDWLPSIAREFVLILPICSSISEFEETYSGSQSGTITPALNDNTRWSEASEIPFSLLYFWTDEEMALFKESFNSRWCYHYAQSLPIAADDFSHTISRPNYERLGRSPEETPDGFVPTDPLRFTEVAAKYKKHLAERSAVTANPFDQWKDTHMLLGLFHIWARISAHPRHHVPPIRFAHVKGLKAYDFLAEAQGRAPPTASLDYQDYIPRYSSEEIYSALTNHRRVHLNLKRKSERFPIREPADEEKRRLEHVAEREELFSAQEANFALFARVERDEHEEEEMWQISKHARIGVKDKKKNSDSGPVVWTRRDRERSG